jgi:hypothetical protein
MDKCNNKCSALTLKKEPCKNNSKHNSSYCGVHLKHVADEIEESKLSTKKGITFYLYDSLDFFTERLKSKNSILTYQLNEWINNILKSKNPIEEYYYIMEIIHKKVGDNVDWEKRVDLLLWSYRECIVCLTFITVDLIFQKGLPSSRKTYKEECTATILGSSTLLSDIDVTIAAAHTSSWIAVIEDLLFNLKWFNFDKFKFSCFGDFILVGKFYISTNHFTDDIQIKLLQLAVTSYFRHKNSNFFDTSILNKLILDAIELKRLDTNIDEIIRAAKILVAGTDSNNREQYYIELQKAEELEKKTINKIEEGKYTDIEITHLFGEVIVQLGIANLYRSENYLLTSTIVHVVKIEQGKHSNISNTCDPILTKVARCSMSNFSYLLSAIEQLGYMQENLSLSNECTLPSNKYFGRLLRAINSAEIIKDKNKYNQLININKELEKQKQERGNKGDNDISCNVNLYKLLKEII